MQRAVSFLNLGASTRRCGLRSKLNLSRRVAFTTTSIKSNPMSRRAWINPPGPTGRPIGLVNAINAPETGKEIWIHETPVPVGTLGRFFEFLSHHRLSNGQVTTVPTLSPSEVAKFMTPYNDWAPAPYNNNRIRSDSAANRFSMCFTGMPDLLDFGAVLSGNGLSDLMTNIDFELEICRQRMWAGMVPLSHRRWAEKKLDSPENIDLAVEYLLKTCDMVHFSLPATSRRARQTYNRGYDVLAHFDTVLDAHYATTTNPNNPRPSPTPRLADLWADFFFSHVHFITNRLHAWAATHVDRLADALMHRLQTAPTVPGATRMSPEQDALCTQYERLSHIIRRLDEMILFPLVGFKNTLPHWHHAASPPIVNWPAYIRSHGATPLGGNYPADIQQRDEVYHQRVANLVRQELSRDMDRAVAAGSEGAFSGEEVARPMRRVRAAYAQGRRELRGEAEPVREEMWIGALRRSMEAQGEGGRPPMYAKWGFVAYRVWYGHSDELWAAFLRKFEEDVKNWGAGIAGAEGVKEKMDIRWVDGRECGIAEGDVEGTRKHFNMLHENEGAGLDGLNAPAFLVADQSSIDSYLEDVALPEQTLIDAADMGPFILVGKKQGVQGEGSGREAPGFEGTVRALGSVLLDDVWPCLWWRHVDVEDMWNLAKWHPSYVYVGTVVQSQVEDWKQFRKVRDDLLRKADQWKRQGRLD